MTCFGGGWKQDLSLGTPLFRPRAGQPRMTAAPRCPFGTAHLETKRPRAYGVGPEDPADTPVTRQTHGRWGGANRPHATPSSLAAKTVPSTRARILAKAVSRVVDVSSPKGEKPQ